MANIMKHANKEGLVKVSPQVLQFILLDEIAGRLAEISEKIGVLGDAQGDIEGGEYTITSSGKFIQIPSGWRGMTIVNDGPNSVYISTAGRGRMAPLKKGETLIISIKRRSIKNIYCWCKSGETATIRIFSIV